MEVVANGSPTELPAGCVFADRCPLRPTLPEDLQRRINALWDVNMGPRLLLMTPDEVRRETNLYLATDPSQQGANVYGAYPYVSVPLGIPNPVAAPAVSVAVSELFPITTLPQSFWMSPISAVLR